MMSLGKGFLLSCFVLMHISDISSLPTELERLRELMKKVASATLPNLRHAERDYVQHILQQEPLTSAKSGHLEGITLPVGNSSAEIQTSICSISDYLGNHLPSIIRNVTYPPQEQVIENATVFHHQFWAAVELTGNGSPAGRVFLQRCPRNLTASGGYKLKEIGFQIIHLSKRWLEGFTHARANFNLTKKLLGQ